MIGEIITLKLRRKPRQAARVNFVTGTILEISQTSIVLQVQHHDAWRVTDTASRVAVPRDQILRSSKEIPWPSEEDAGSRSDSAEVSASGQEAPDQN